MFTGIITAIGTITDVHAHDHGATIEITCNDLPWHHHHLGDSIAVSGTCLTLCKIHKHGFSADVSNETLACTTGLDRLGSQVNLEPALKVGDALGGHFVSGHVDTVATVIARTPLGEHHCFELAIPTMYMPYIVRKGSVTINGVSLTVNAVTDETHCQLNLIPHTLEHSNLGGLAAGDSVNLEIDLIARYLAKLIRS